MIFHSVTTLNEIRAHAPCKEGWEKLLSHLGKNQADDEPLALLTILGSNGLDDALWCLRAKSLDRLSRHFQAWCADQVLHLFEAERPDDTRVRAQIAMMRNDDATDPERDSARAAAWASAGASAGAAARAAAVASARDAARASSWAGAGASARDAAWAGSAAWASAWDAAGATQEKQLRAMIGGEA